MANSASELTNFLKILNESSLKSDMAAEVGIELDLTVPNAS